METHQDGKSISKEKIVILTGHSTWQLLRYFNICNNIHGKPIRHNKAQCFGVMIHLDTHKSVLISFKRNIQVPRAHRTHNIAMIAPTILVEKLPNLILPATCEVGVNYCPYFREEEIEELRWGNLPGWQHEGAERVLLEPRRVTSNPVCSFYTPCWMYLLMFCCGRLLCPPSHGLASGPPCPSPF